jgi:hypothetical protein
MAIFTVYVPPNSTADALARRTLFIEDAFSWGAFLLGPLWFFGHRMWLGLTLWIAGAGAAVLAVAALHLPFSGILVLGVLGLFLIGLEANSLRRAATAMKGFRLADVVAAPCLEDAERAFFHRWLARRSAIDIGEAEAQPYPTQPQMSVGGFFPEAGG